MSKQLRVAEASEAGDVIERLLKHGTRQALLDADVVHRLVQSIGYLETELETDLCTCNLSDGAHYRTEYC